MKWRAAKTLKLKLVLAKVFVVLSHTPLSQTVTVWQLFQEFDFQQLQVLPPFLSPSTTAEWAKITDARKADK